MIEKKLTRRAFVGGVAWSSLATVGLLCTAETRSSKEDFSLEGPIKVGNLKLSALTTDHTIDAWERHGAEVAKNIDNFPIIIPEYFPLEYSGTKGNSITKVAVNLYKEANHLFDKIEEYCRNTKKEVWVVDPAYNASFMALRGSMLVAEAALTMGVAVKLLGEPEVAKQQKINRRNFLKQAGTLGITAGAFCFGSVFPLEFINLASSRGMIGATVESELRHALIARLIVDLSEQLPSESQALLIYPRFHWQGIKGYLLNDQKRKDFLSKIAKLKDVPGTDLFFEGRRYISDGNMWNEKPRIKAQIF